MFFISVSKIRKEEKCQKDGGYVSDFQGSAQHKVPDRFLSGAMFFFIIILGKRIRLLSPSREVHTFKLQISGSF